jgi:hypothetical protein
MKTSFLLALAVALTTAGKLSAAQIAYTDAGAVGNNTGSTNPLNIGREFVVTGQGIYITSLGIFDADRSGNEISMTNSHAVTLFKIGATGSANPSNTEITSVTVPSGLDASWSQGYAFAPIATTYLAPGDYAVIAYGLDDGNIAYGDGNNNGRLSSPNANDAHFDPYQFTSNASPAFPTGGDGNDHNGASFQFITAVPEPSSLVALAGLGAMGLFVLIRRRRA